MVTMKQLKCVGLAAVISIPLLAHADMVDCSSASKWNSNTHYKNGDLVWHHNGGNVWIKYSCNITECYGGGIGDEPGQDSGKHWKSLGSCNKSME